MEIENFWIEDSFVSLRAIYLGKQQEVQSVPNKLLKDELNRTKLANCLKAKKYFKQETVDTVKLLFPAIEVSSTDSEETETILRKKDCAECKECKEFATKINRTTAEEAKECTNKQEIALNCLVLKFKVSDFTDLPLKKAKKSFDWCKMIWEIALLVMFVGILLALNPYKTHEFHRFSKEDLFVFDNKLFTTTSHKPLAVQLEGIVKVGSDGVFAAKQNVLSVYPWNAAEFEVLTTGTILDYSVGELTVMLDKNRILYLVYDKEIKHIYPIALDADFNRIILQGNFVTLFSYKSNVSAVFLLGINGIQLFSMEKYENKIRRVSTNGIECYISSNESTSQYKLVNGQVVLFVVSYVRSMFCGKIDGKLLLIENNHLVIYNEEDKEVISRVANVKDCAVSDEGDILIKDNRGVKIKRRHSDYIEAIE